MLSQFQDIVDKICEKGKFGGWFNVWMKLGESPVICLGQDEAVFKGCIFTKKMWTHKGKYRLVPKDEEYGIVILAFQSREFGFVYPLTVPYLQTINECHALHLKYAGIDAVNSVVVRTHN